MGILDKLKKKEKEFSSPFTVQGLAVSLLADPTQEDYPRALYTLSDLSDKEITSLSMIMAIESMFQMQLGQPTVLSAFTDSILLLKRSRKRKGENSIINLFKKTGIQTPITLQPIKRIFSSKEQGEE